MSSKKGEHLDKLLMRRKIADPMLRSAIPYYTAVRHNFREICLSTKCMDAETRERNVDEFLCTMAYLECQGCDGRSLDTVLELAAAIRSKDGRDWFPKAKRVKALATKMRRLAGEIRAAEHSHFLTILNQKETAKWRAETGLGPEDIEDLSQTFPFMAVPKWLEKRAAMYDEWCNLASQNIPTKGLPFERVGRVCIALYVKYATGRTYFPEVSKLLKLCQFGTSSPTQLSRELKEFEAAYPGTCDELQFQFQQLHPPNLKPSGEHIIRISENVLKSSKLFKYCVPRGDSVYEVKSAVAIREELKDRVMGTRCSVNRRVPKKRSA